MAEVSRFEMCHFLPLLVVNQHHLHIVFPFAHAAIQGHANGPLCKVGFGKGAVEHAFKINNEIKSYRINIISIGDNDVFAHSDVAIFL